MPDIRSVGWRAGPWLVVAAVSMSAAFQFRELAFTQLGYRPYFPYIGAVVVTAWAGGLVPGLLATVVAALLDWWTWPAEAIPPRWFGTVGFSAVGVLAATIIDRLRRLVERERAGRDLLEREQRERERAEASVRERRSVFDALMQAVPALVVMAHDREGQRITANALTTTILGVDPGANLSEPAAAPGTPRLDTGPLLEAARTGREVRDSELGLQFPDGRRVTLFGSAVPVRGASGRVTGAVAVYLDITARKAAQEALLASERRFRALIDKSADVIVVCDHLRRFTFASPSIQSATGYTPEEFFALAPEDFWHAADLEAWSAMFEQLRSLPGAATSLQSRYRHRDGAWRWFEGTYTSLFQEAAVGGLVANLRDVTGRKRAELDRELLAGVSAEVGEYRDESSLVSATCRRLAAHLDVPYCAVIDSTTPGGTTCWASWAPEDAGGVGPALEMLTRARSIERLGGRTAVVPDLAVDPRIADADREACRGAGVHAVLIVRLLVEGTLGAALVVASRASRAWSADDIGVVENLGTRLWYAVQQRRLFRQQLEARRAAEAASVLKDEFVAGVSHELRTPLNAILGWAQVGIADPAQRDRALDTIARNARRQAQLVDELLDLARMVAGHDQLTLTAVDLADVVRSAIEVLTPAAQEKGVVLNAKGLASAAVLGDAARLQQVAWNLLSNAVKFTPSGGAVETEIAVVDREVVLRVRDSGDGIDPTFLPHVFERFRQAEPSAGRRHGGLGLGLSITRHLVEAHRGRVTAASEGAGRGSVFTVHLPLSQVPVKPRPRSRTDIAALSPSNLGGLMVLVVDDEADTRHYVEAALRRQGAEVITAASSREAIDRLTQAAPDILLADIGMADGDGISLIRAVRNLPGSLGRIPAAAITAFAGEGDRARALAAGFHLHLSKPLDIPALIGSVARLAGREVHRGPEAAPAATSGP